MGCRLMAAKIERVPVEAFGLCVEF